MEIPQGAFLWATNFVNKVKMETCETVFMNLIGGALLVSHNHTAIFAQGVITFIINALVQNVVWPPYTSAHLFTIHIYWYALHMKIHIMNPQKTSSV